LKAANKAMTVLQMVKRNLRRLDVEGFRIIYKGYIHQASFEMLCLLWSPFLGKAEEILENVQRHAAKLVRGLRHKHCE